MSDQAAVQALSINPEVGCLLAETMSPSFVITGSFYNYNAPQVVVVPDRQGLASQATCHVSSLARSGLMGAA